jgi:DNA-binding XRE family transcriptional regulator
LTTRTDQENDLKMAESAKFETPLRDLRQSLGFSQERLARELRVSRQTIVNIENGATVPNVLLAIGLAVLLKVTVEKLFRQLEQLTWVT